MFVPSAKTFHTVNSSTFYPKRSLLFWIALIALISPFIGNAEEKAGFREEFKNLDRWKPLEFRSIKKHSIYTIEKEGDVTALKTESNNSASGLVLKTTFNIYDSPVMRWRWKTNNVYKNAKGMGKEGDDYPLRLYVLFQQSETEVFFLKKIAIRLLESFYGDSLPDSAFSYVWSSEKRAAVPYPAPGVDDAYILPINSGVKNVGKWQQNSVNIVDDYHRAFGKKPPPTASLAIMNDSDSTNESSVSFIDFIELTVAD